MRRAGRVLVLSGCSDKGLSWGADNSRKLFLSVLEAGSWRSGCRHGWASVRTLLQVADCPPFVASSCGRKKAKELFGVPC